ncbi:hypothetical protein ACG3SL_02945 [Sphingomonas sp. CJ20]
MSRGPDAGTLLARALVAAADAAGCPVMLVEGDWTRWASATFVGARHVLVLRGPCGTALDRWIAGLPDAELALRGHLVADLTIAGVTRTPEGATIRVEALTVEER